MSRLHKPIEISRIIYQCAMYSSDVAIDLTSSWQLTDSKFFGKSSAHKPQCCYHLLLLSEETSKLIYDYYHNTTLVSLDDYDKTLFNNHQLLFNNSSQLSDVKRNYYLYVLLCCEHDDASIRSHCFSQVRTTITTHLINDNNIDIHDLNVLD